MALCSTQLDSVLPQIKEQRDEAPCEPPSVPTAPRHMPHTAPPLSLTVDYRSPRAHFIPAALELRPPPAKRPRGRPRVDKTSAEYIAKHAARRKMREEALAKQASNPVLGVVKRKRGRPRVDKTSPEYLARKRAKELEALEKKAKRQYKRRTTGDSAASSSATEGAVRVKRKYTRRAPLLNPDGTPIPPKKRGRKRKVILGPDGQPLDPQPPPPNSADKPKGKRGRKKKSELLAAAAAAGIPPPTPGRPRGRGGGKGSGRRGRPPLASTLAQRQLMAQMSQMSQMAQISQINSEPITLDSSDEQSSELGSPGRGSDSLSLDENLRALRHLHEKYAHIEREGRLDGMGTARSATDAATQGSENKVTRLEDSSEGSDDDEDGTQSGSDSSSDSNSGSSSDSDSDSSDSSSSGDDSDSSSGEEEGGEKHAKASVNGKSDPPVVTIDLDSERPAWTGSTERLPVDSASSHGSDSDASRPHSPDPGHVSESSEEGVDSSFQCDVCHKCFSTSVTLKIHKRGHASRGSSGGRGKRRPPERYECDCCDAAFARKEKLHEHKAEVHRGAMTVRCEVCRRCFEDEQELVQHQDAHTEDERQGRCSSCGATYARYEQLRRHRAAAHGAPSPQPRHAARHACSQCGKVFSHAHSLTRHLSNHSKAIYKCVVCKQSFSHADELAQHLNSHLDRYKKLKP